MEKEALFLESLDMALAAHNSGGLVMVQVERLAAVKSLDPRRGLKWMGSKWVKLYLPPENEEMWTLKRDHFSLSGKSCSKHHFCFQVSCISCQGVPSFN